VIDDEKIRAAADKLRFLVKNPAAPHSLYHYTTAHGLLGILKNDENQFWASEIGFSNDASEGRYATDVGLSVINGHPLSSDVAASCKEVSGFARSLFSLPGRIWEEGYVVSFCAEDNCLSQWRAYGGTSSFSIGFGALATDVLECSGGSDIRLVKVEYEVSEQKRKLTQVLDGTYKFLKSPLADPEAKWAYFACAMLHFSLTQWACSVKHKAFREEREWRVIVFPSYEYSRNAAFYGEAPRLVSHPELREHRGRLLPYVIVKPKTGKFNIESITVGPSKIQSLDAKAVELLKEKLGLGDAKVLLSDIPLQS
jgi:hypothetical protein